MKHILTLIIYFSFNLNLFCQESSNYLVQTWIQVGRNDPYNGDEIHKTDTLIYKRVIRFTSAGHYYEKDTWANNIYGKWELNSSATRIGVNYLKFRDKIHEDKPITEYRLEIIELTKNSLVIGEQGRHGICKTYYITTGNEYFDEPKKE